MVRWIKKTLVIVMVLSLVVGTTMSVSAGNAEIIDENGALQVTGTPIAQQELDKVLEDLGISKEQVQYEKEANALLEQIKTPKNRAAQTAVDTNFGGAYINDDGKMVVLLTEEVQKTLRAKSSNYAIQEALSMNVKGSLSNNIEIGVAKYTYAELTDVKQKIDDYLFAESPEKAAEILAELCVESIDIDSMENRVVVYFNGITDDKIADFKNVILDAEQITYKDIVDAPWAQNQSERAAVSPRYVIGDPISTVTVGTKCWTQGDYPYDSRMQGILGVPALSHQGSSSFGFITAVHGDWQRYRLLNQYNYVYGYGQQGQFGGSIDARFFNGGNCTYSYPTATVFRGSYMMRGTSIIKYNLSYYTTGKIVSESNTGSTQISKGDGNTYSFTDIYLTDYASSDGCSGAPVYTTDWQLIGMHMGQNTQKTVGLACKSRNIENTLNLTLMP